VLPIALGMLGNYYFLHAVNFLLQVKHGLLRLLHAQYHLQLHLYLLVLHWNNLLLLTGRAAAQTHAVAAERLLLRLRLVSKHVSPL
jgi:hypothetical protein